MNTNKPKVYFFLADGFEEVEALCPLDLLLRAGADAVTVSIGETVTVTGTHGIAVAADMTIAELPDRCDADMIVLPGGMPGTANLADSEKVCAYVTEQAENGKFAAAICAAPSVLGTLGVLEGKKAVCFPGFEKYLRGAEIVNEKVVRDGNVITAVGMGAAFEFGFELVAALFGEKTAKDLELSSKYTLS
ncbi:MAG: DJ-1/PfpI family protein [Clostridia bacterium]|nr:DJ-1/PfpI family protein [Clostridia bacterium]